MAVRVHGKNMTYFKETSRTEAAVITLLLYRLLTDANLPVALPAVLE